MTHDPLPPRLSAAEDLDLDDLNLELPEPSDPERGKAQVYRPPVPAPLMLVETAFFASTSSLLWLINAYFPVGPILRFFFPIPIALTYLRWGSRAAWMATIVSGLLLSILMGPPRSIQFLIPFGLLGVQLGFLWRRRAHWYWSILTGPLVGVVGFFFRVWLLSLMTGDDLWVYVTTQVTDLAKWIFLKLGLMDRPELWFIQILIVGMVLLSNLIYLFVIHLVAVLLLERLGNPIPAPPRWVQILLDYEPIP